MAIAVVVEIDIVGRLVRIHAKPGQSGAIIECAVYQDVVVAAIDDLDLTISGSRRGYPRGGEYEAYR